MSETFAGPDGKPRCGWCGAAPEFLAYHDAEWGFPVDDDRHRRYVVVLQLRTNARCRDGSATPARSSAASAVANSLRLSRGGRRSQSSSSRIDAKEIQRPTMTVCSSP